MRRLEDLKEIPMSLWRNDPQTQEEAQIVIDAMDREGNLTDMGAWFKGNQSTDAVEMMRDQDMRLATAANIFMNSDNLTTREKQAFNWLRNTYAKTYKDSASEYGRMFKDYGIDMVTDPVSAISVLAGIGSGGVSVAAKQAATKKLNQSIVGAIASKASSKPVVTAGILSGAETATEDFLVQNAELGTNVIDEKKIIKDKNYDNIREQYDKAQTASSAGVGFLIGSAMTTAGRQIVKWANKTFNANEMERRNILLNGKISPEENQKVLDTTEELYANRPSRTRSKEEQENYERFLAGRTIGQRGSGEQLDLDFEGYGAKIAKENGLSKETGIEIAEEAAEIAAIVPSPTMAKNSIAYNTSKFLSSLNGKVLSKPTTILDPIAKFSPTAKLLQQKLRYDSTRPLFGEKDYLPQDFNEIFNEVSNTYRTKYTQALEPIQTTTRGTLQDLTNDELIRALRLGRSSNPEIEKARSEVRGVLKEIEVRLKDNKLIEGDIVNYVPRSWNREAIEKNPDDFKAKLIKAGEVDSTEEAERLVEDMLDKRNQLGEQGGGANFFYRRAFKKLKDEDFEDYLEDNLNTVMNDYFTNVGKQIAKVEHLGVVSLGSSEKKAITQDGVTRLIDDPSRSFNTVWIDTIADELKEKGKVLTLKDRENLQSLYRSTTGEFDSSFLGEGPIPALAETYGIANRLAYLPLATASSLTEILINFQKADPTPAFKALINATGDAVGNTNLGMRDLLKQSGYTKSEIRKELNEFGIALDLGIEDVVQRLAGEELHSKIGRKVNNVFFKVTLLDQWTKLVQTASFLSGKEIIQNNLKKIATHQASGLAPTRRIDRLRGELLELGIKDIDEGVKWVNEGASIKNPWYKNVKRGAARYTNEVILQPSPTANIKPLLLSKPRTSLLFQFTSYPAAFANVVLRNAGRDLVRGVKEGDIKNVSKTLATGLAMTAVARMTNSWRSDGESEKYETEMQKNRDAAIRWGGGGYGLDQLYRGRKAAEVYQNPAVGVASFFGPLGSDLSRQFSYFSPASALGQKIPFYGAIDPVISPVAKKLFDIDISREDYVKYLREKDKEAKDFLTPEKETPVREVFSAGSKVIAKEGLKIVRKLIEKINPKLKDDPDIINTYGEETINLLAQESNRSLYNPTHKAVMLTPRNKDGTITIKNLMETLKNIGADADTQKLSGLSDILKNYSNDQKISQNELASILLQESRKSTPTYREYQSQRNLSQPGSFFDKDTAKIDSPLTGVNVIRQDTSEKLVRYPVDEAGREIDASYFKDKKPDAVFEPIPKQYNVAFPPTGDLKPLPKGFGVAETDPEFRDFARNILYGDLSKDVKKIQDQVKGSAFESSSYRAVESKIQTVRNQLAKIDKNDGEAIAALINEELRDLYLLTNPKYKNLFFKERGEPFSTSYQGFSSLHTKALSNLKMIDKRAYGAVPPGLLSDKLRLNDLALDNPSYRAIGLARDTRTKTNFIANTAHEQIQSKDFSTNTERFVNLRVANYDDIDGNKGTHGEEIQFDAYAKGEQVGYLDVSQERYNYLLSLDDDLTFERFQGQEINVYKAPEKINEDGTPEEVIDVERQIIAYRHNPTDFMSEDSPTIQVQKLSSELITPKIQNKLNLLQDKQKELIELLESPIDVSISDKNYATSLGILLEIMPIENFRFQELKGVKPIQYSGTDFQSRKGSAARIEQDESLLRLAMQQIIPRLDKPEFSKVFDQKIGSELTKEQLEFIDDFKYTKMSLGRYPGDSGFPVIGKILESDIGDEISINNTIRNNMANWNRGESTKGLEPISDIDMFKILKSIKLVADIKGYRGTLREKEIKGIEEEIQDYARDLQSYKVPPVDLPFKKKGPDMAIRQLLLEAVEDDSSFLSFPTGEIMRDRYSNAPTMTYDSKLVNAANKVVKGFKDFDGNPLEIKKKRIYALPKDAVNPFLFDPLVSNEIKQNVYKTLLPEVYYLELTDDFKQYIRDFGIPMTGDIKLKEDSPVIRGLKTQDSPIRRALNNLKNKRQGTN